MGNEAGRSITLACYRDNLLIPSDNSVIPSGYSMIPSPHFMISSPSSKVPSSHLSVPSPSSTVPSHYSMTPSAYSITPSQYSVTSSGNESSHYVYITSKTFFISRLGMGGFLFGFCNTPIHRRLYGWSGSAHKNLKEALIKKKR